jgi:hypothetical protein
MIKPHLLREKEAADYVGFAVKTLQRRRWAGQPPSYIKAGARVLYDVADLDRFLNAGRVER